MRITRASEALLALREGRIWKLLAADRLPWEFAVEAVQSVLDS